MGKRILKDDIAEKGVLDNLLTPLIQLKALLESTSAMLADFAKNAKESLSFQTDAKGLREQEALMRKIQKAYEAKIKAEKEALRLAREIDKVQKDRWSAEQSLQKQREKALNDISKSEARRLRERQSAEQSLQRQRERGLAQMEKERAKAAELNRPYVQLDLTLKKLRKEYQDLAASGQTNTTRARELRAEMNRLNTTLNSIDADTGVYTRNVGNYTESIKKGFKGAMNIIGQFGLALGGVALAQGAVKVLRDFDEGAANMAKTLDITKDSARNLSQELLKIDTKTSITDLQTIASIGGQLGISAKDIVAFTTATDKLNVALGDEFTGGAEEITAVLGGLRNVFSDLKTDKVDVDLLKIGNALNVLGAKGSATSPVMADFAGRIGGIGIPLGLTTDEVLGLSSTLQELNVNAERGGTAITKVLQKMTVNTKDFAKIAGMDLKAFEQLVNTDIYGAFQAVVSGAKESGTTATELGSILDDLGLDGAGTSEVFLKLGANMELLDKRTTQAGEALKSTDSIVQEFNVKNSTLGATMDMLSKEFDKYVLGIDEAGNVSGKFGTVLNFLVHNFQGIVKILVFAIKQFLIFKAVMKAMELKKAYDEWKDLRKGVEGASKALSDGSSSGKKFGDSLKAIGWTVLIDLAFELGTEIYRIASGAAQAEEDLARMNKQLELGAKIGSKVSEKALGLQNKAIAEAERLARVRIANGEDEKKVNADLLKQKEGIIQKTNETLKVDIKQNIERKKYLQTLKGELKDIERRSKNPNISRETIKRDINRQTEIEKIMGTTDIDNINDLVAQLDSGIAGINARLKEEFDALNGNTEAFKDNGVAIIENTTSKRDQVKETKKLNTELEKLNEYTSSYIELFNESQNIKSNNEIKVLNKDIEDFIELQKKSIDETGFFNEDELRDMLHKKEMMLEQQVLNSVDFEISELKRKNNELELEELKAIEKNRLELLSQEGLTSEQKLEINRSYLARIEELRNKMILIRQDEADEIINIEDKAQGEIEDIVDESNQEIKDKIKDLFDYRKDATEKSIEEEKALKEKSDSDEKARLEKMAKFRNEIIKQGTEYLTDQIDKQIAIEQKKSDDSARLEDLLSEKAKEGNISANESIIEQQRIQEESDRKKIELERRKANIIAVSSLLQSFNNKVNAGDKFALAETAVESGALLALLNSLPKFYSGTETTLGAQSAPTKLGKDGHLIWADKEERILNPTLSGKIPANVTNSQLVDGYLDGVSNKFATGSMMYRENFKQDTAGNSFDIAPLLRQNQELIDAVNSIPSQQLTAEQVAMGMIKLMAISKTGGVTTRNEYVIRK